MPSSFGPWATSMSTGSHVELSTFWKRRMNMLPKIARLSTKLSHRARLVLVLCSVALFAMPTLFVAAQSTDKATGTAKTGTDSVRSAQPASQAAAPSEGATDATTTPASMATRIEFYPALSKKERTIVDELESNTSFDFTDESLQGIRETVMEQHGFDIVIDLTRLEEESIAADATDITLRVNEVPLRSALKLLLDKKHMAFTVEDDVMKFTTKTAAADQRLTRIYPVRDLTGTDDADYLTLTEAIKQGVDPGGWREVQHVGPAAYAAPAAANSGMGGGAKNADLACTISMVPATGSLVIRQSFEGHNEILRLIRALRMAKGDAAPQAKALQTY